MSEELPKQIWAWKQSFITRWSSIGAGTDTVKYIREDIHAARVKELEAVVNKLWRRQDSLDTFDAAVVTEACFVGAPLMGEANSRAYQAPKRSPS